MHILWRLTKATVKSMILSQCVKISARSVLIPSIPSPPKYMWLFNFKTAGRLFLARRLIELIRSRLFR